MPSVVLDIIILLPLAAALAIALLPEASVARLAKPCALGTGAVELVLALWMVIAFKTGNAHAGFQFTSLQPWISPIGISWYIGVDGISLFLVAMTALLFPIAMASPPAGRSPRAYFGWMLLLEAACMTTFLSLDAFLFFVAFEVTLVPGYFLIVSGGGARRGYAATKFFLYTFAGSAFLFVGILAAYLLAAGHLPSGTSSSFNIVSLARGTAHLPISDQELLLASFGVAFAVKMPLVPFHTWMPDAYTEAPTGASMVLAGILFKLGAYGILRWGIFLFPVAAVRLAPVALTLAAIGIIWGSVVAAVQRDLKRLVAYGTITGVGFIVIGLFGFTTQGITGGIVEMVNHGLSTGGLFLLVGMVWERRRTYKFSELGGLQSAAPILGWVFMAVIMSDIGLPGLNGFIGELLVLLGTFVTHRWWAVLATVGVVTGAVYLLWAYQRVFMGPAQAVNSAVRDMTWAEKAAVAPLLAGILFIGIYPQALLTRIEPSVDHLVQHVEYADPSFKLPAPAVGHGTFAVPADQVVDLPAAPSSSAAASAGGGS
ncbi:MAG TPA: NADH-quinone oxidoreductase subunit M [Acidimicrobiales bacterium]|nr:NADH-quinone oxidoreductase subunit M [Acidimicrobiales bacterium]